MIAAAMLFAAALWAGAWLLAVFLRDGNEQPRLVLILAWSIVPTWLAVENNLFQPYLMSAILLPTLILMARHARGQAMIRARVTQQKSRQAPRR